LLLALPAGVALFVIPEALIAALFERGEFTAEDTAIAAKVLMGYAIGLPAYIVVKVFSTAYWSSQDTMSPVKISIVITLMNIALSVVLIQFIGVVGIALATGIIGWLQLALLYRGLRGQAHFIFDARFKRAAVKIVFSSIVMALVLLAVNTYVSVGEGKIIMLAILVLSGLIVYGVGVISTKAISIAELKQFLSKKKA
jgi:putative peptidoglycan lipid II flippase